MRLSEVVIVAGPQGKRALPASDLPAAVAIDNLSRHPHPSLVPVLMDDSKNTLIIGIMVFCLVVIGFQVFFNSGDSFGPFKMIGGLLLASFAAVAAYAVANATKK